MACFIESSLTNGVIVDLISSILLHARDEPDNGVDVEVDLVFSNEILINSSISTELIFLWLFFKEFITNCRKSDFFVEEIASNLSFVDLASDKKLAEERRNSLVNLLKCEDRLAL